MFRSIDLKTVQEQWHENSLQETLHPLPRLLYYFTFQPVLTHWHSAG